MVFGAMGFFLWQICDVATTGDHSSQGDLATFGYGRARKVEIY